MSLIEAKANILVADDNPANLQLMESLLSKMGHEVRVAMNGLEVLSSVEADKPDLIILDIHMPEMDGYEACLRLKQQAATKDIPIMFATAINEEFNKVRAFDIGAVDYITKPVQYAEVHARVQVHLSMAQQRKELIEKTIELKAFNDTMLEREMRVIELKNEVNQLCEQLGKDKPYPNLEQL
jgi:CheY-like chemotaxis protein